MMYFLSNHAHVCISNGYIVILDTKQDQYHCLPKNLTEKFSSLVADGVVFADEKDCEMQSNILNLVSEKIIHSSEFRSCNPKGLLRFDPKRDLTDAPLFIKRNEVNVNHIVKFVSSFLEVCAIKNIIGFHGLLKYVNSRPVRRGHSMDNLENVVFSFRKIRPIFYTSSNKCLIDSAIMMVFLRKFGYEPQWIFGVSMDPFSAHCWVQVEDLLVTDPLYAIDGYDPIMII